MLETAPPVLSFKVTVISEVVALSAGTEVRDATTVELPAVAPKVTVAVCVIGTPAVVSVALKMAVPAVVEDTLKVATPETFAATGGLMLTFAVTAVPPVFARLTVSRLVTKALPLSFKVTVIVEAVTPSAGTVRGFAVTVEFVGSVTPAVASTVEASPAVMPRLNTIAAPTRAIRDVANAILSSCFSGLAAEFSNDAARTPNRLSVAASAACIGPTWPRRPKVVAWARSV